LQRVVAYARGAGFRVHVGLADVSRAEPAFIAAVAQAAEAAGSVRLRLADTLGLLDPWSAEALVAGVASATTIEIAIHAHDDVGLATAVSLGAVRGGATHVDTTVGGLGERAGNAALEEVAVALHHRFGLVTGVDLTRLPALAARVAAASGRPVPAGKAVVGADVFTHESGVHVAALIADEATYDGLSPALVGRRHRIVLGKHSGVAGLKAAYAAIGRPFDADEARRVLRRIRASAGTTKRAVPLAGIAAFLDPTPATPSSLTPGSVP
jgi:homocitrate synthase NifV